jgi:hypothetical protein
MMELMAAMRARGGELPEPARPGLRLLENPSVRADRQREESRILALPAKAAPGKKTTLQVPKTTVQAPKAEAKAASRRSTTTPGPASTSTRGPPTHAYDPVLAREQLLLVARTMKVPLSYMEFLVDCMVMLRVRTWPTDEWHGTLAGGYWMRGSGKKAKFKWVGRGDFDSIQEEMDVARLTAGWLKKQGIDGATVDKGFAIMLKPLGVAAQQASAGADGPPDTGGAASSGKDDDNVPQAKEAEKNPEEEQKADEEVPDNTAEEKDDADPRGPKRPRSPDTVLTPFMDAMRKRRAQAAIAAAEKKGVILIA